MATFTTGRRKTCPHSESGQMDREIGQEDIYINNNCILFY
jgi:hypothetical protein